VGMKPDAICQCVERRNATFRTPLPSHFGQK
jgi:hypothetical protein